MKYRLNVRGMRKTERILCVFFFINEPAPHPWVLPDRAGRRSVAMEHGLAEQITASPPSFCVCSSFPGSVSLPAPSVLCFSHRARQTQRTPLLFRVGNATGAKSASVPVWYRAPPPPPFVLAAFRHHVSWLQTGSVKLADDTRLVTPRCVTDATPRANRGDVQPQRLSKPLPTYSAQVYRWLKDSGSEKTGSLDPHLSCSSQVWKAEWYPWTFRAASSKQTCVCLHPPLLLPERRWDEY